MKTIRVGWLAVALMLLASVPGLTQSGQDLFQQALVKERSDGNLRAAIALYERIVRDFARDRALAAKALVQAGRCHEKLGVAETGAARKAYGRVVREFGDQTDVAAEARTRLAALPGAGSSAGGATLAVRRIWAGPDVDLEGGVSPDGRYISFIDWSTGDLAVRDLVKGENRRLTANPSGSTEYADFAAFSPDGRQLAFGWCCDKSGPYDLRTIAVDGSGLRVVPRAPEMTYFMPQAWSRDGRRILAVVARQRSYQIALVSVADGSIQPLKSIDPPAPHLSLSPDGQWLAFDYAAAENPAQHDIHLMAVDGTREVTLIEHPADDLRPLWAPDGRQLLFVSDRGGTPGLWAVSVHDGRTQGLPLLVKPDVGRIRPFSVIAGGLLYYGLTAGTGEVYEAELDPKGGKLTSSPLPALKHYVGFNATPDYSPDGQFLACVSSRGSGTGNNTLIVRSLQTGKEQEFPLNSPFGFELRWSPDSRSVLIPGRDVKAGFSLYVVDATSGEMKRLGMWASTNNIMGTRKGWFPDGQSLYFVAGAPPDASGKSRRRLVRYALAGGQTQDIFVYTPDEGDLRWVMLSPDGQHFAFWRHNDKTASSVLQVMPAAGGQPRELFATKGHVGFVETSTAPRGLSWTPDGRYLFFAGRLDPDGNETALWRIPAAGGTPEKSGLLPQRVYDVVVHPSGTRVAFSTIERRQEVWVMENFLPMATAMPAARITERRNGR